MKTALITGITGQDGSYLAEFLLERGYRVVGIVRPSSTTPYERIAHILDRLELLNADLLDQSSLTSAIEIAAPDEIYNLASQSIVSSSWQQPVLTGELTAIGVTRFLEAMRRAAPQARFYQASSSEIFGRVAETPQRETTPLYPRSPYGAAKAYAHWITINYRESHGLFAVAGILFNHESPRRGLDFVTRKITHGAARIKLGLATEVRLGNLDARRDWGFAGEYVDAMWRMLQLDTPEDFVIGTGVTHTVRELCDAAFTCLGLDYREHIRQDAHLMRPSEVDLTVADASKAARLLDWRPTWSFERLIASMVDADMALLTAARR